MAPVYNVRKQAFVCFHCVNWFAPDFLAFNEKKDAFGAFLFVYNVAEFLNYGYSLQAKDYSLFTVPRFLSL